ncbi:MAG: RNA methyltransferase [Bacteroidales bacterium]|nr:RNA methyltransferase [Bacteroidales bacterium]
MSHGKLSMQQLGRMSVEEFKSSDKTPVVLVLDNIRSMSNIGSVFRTADAFRLEEIFLCGITATPPHREINKTALGATQSVKWQYAESTLECVNALKAQGYSVYALEQTENSIPLQNFAVNRLPLALVLGNEVEGVSQDVIDACGGVIEIPQFGTKHSFNVSVSCGIVLWETVKQILIK